MGSCCSCCKAKSVKPTDTYSPATPTPVPREKTVPPVKARTPTPSPKSSPVQRFDEDSYQINIIGGENYHVERSNVLFNAEGGNKQFISRASPPEGCNASCAASIGKYVYILGGAAAAMRCIQVYNTETNRWRFHKDIIKSGRCFASVSVVGDKLVLNCGVGGYNLDCLSTLEVIRAEGLRCTRILNHLVPEVQQARSHHMSVAIKSVVYIIGGDADDKTGLRSCEAVNIRTNKRFDIPSMNKGRAALSAVAFRGAIYAISGLDSKTVHKTVEMYTPQTDSSWTILPSELNIGRMGHCACVTASYIYVVGGYQTDSVEIYDPDGDLWYDVATLPGERLDSVVVATDSTKRVSFRSTDDIITNGGYY